MPDTRLTLVALCIFMMIYIIYMAVDAAFTESLDEKTISLIYKQGDDANGKPKEMREFLEKRLDNGFVRAGTTIYVTKGKPDQKLPISQNKIQVIETTLQGMELATMTSYDRKIAQVKLTDDGKYAYVGSTETSSGKLNVTLPNKQKTTIPYNAASSCIDTLAVVKKEIHLLRSECQTKMAILE